MSNNNDESKLDATYTFRLPSATKVMVDKLPIDDKADLNRRLRVEIAKKLHEINFDPSVYLSIEE